MYLSALSLLKITVPCRFPPLLSPESLGMEDRSIGELGLSNRTYNLLVKYRSAEILNLSDLLNQTKENLLAIWGFGPVALQEVFISELIGWRKQDFLTGSYHYQ